MIKYSIILPLLKYSEKPAKINHSHFELMNIMDWIIFLFIPNRFSEQYLLKDIDCYSEYLIQVTILGLGRKARASRSIWYQLQLCQKLETTFVLLSAAHRPLILTLNNVAPYNTSTSSSSNTSSIQFKCTMGCLAVWKSQLDVNW